MENRKLVCELELCENTATEPCKVIGCDIWVYFRHECMLGLGDEDGE